MTDLSKPASGTLTSPVDPTQQNTDPQEQFAAAVDDLLDQLQHKFDNVSREIFGKLDDMARRLDELEASFTGVADSGIRPGTGTGTGSPTPTK